MYKHELFAAGVQAPIWEDWAHGHCAPLDFPVRGAVKNFKSLFAYELKSGCDWLPFQGHGDDEWYHPKTAEDYLELFLGYYFEDYLKEEGIPFPELKAENFKRHLKTVMDDIRRGG